LDDMNRSKEELIEELQQLRQHKNTFINMLSHELRNPLTSAMMGVELSEKILQEGGQATKTIKIVRRQLKQLNRMVDDLLDVARITENRIILKQEEVDLNQIVKQAIEDYRWQFSESGVILNTEFTSTLQISADSVRMTQAVGNLLHNAVKFTDRGKDVSVVVSRSEDQREALITVRDTGMGIDPKDLPNIFEPLSQVDKSLDRKYGGLGLGLSITKGIVELHGGTITAASDGLGKGSLLIIRLPILYRVQDHCATADKEEPLRILIIDDMPDILEIMSALLEHLGHEVITAESGFEGIVKAKEFHPHVLFCDIGLPGINGYEVAKFFHADDELKDTYLIAFSGYARPEDRECSKEAGFQVHLSKPVGIEDLKESLRGFYKSGIDL